MFGIDLLSFSPLHHQQGAILQHLSDKRESKHSQKMGDFLFKNQIHEDKILWVSFKISHCAESIFHLFFSPSFPFALTFFSSLRVAKYTHLLPRVLFNLCLPTQFTHTSLLSARLTWTNWPNLPTYMLIKD